MTSAFSRVSVADDVSVDLPPDAPILFRLVLFSQMERLFNDVTLGFVPLSRLLREELVAHPNGPIGSIFSSVCAAAQPKITASVTWMENVYLQ